MANVTLKLWSALQGLKDDEFKKFKWFLKQDDVSAALLEKADRQDTVDLMAQKYGGAGAVKETVTVLEKISRNDLVPGLQNSCLDSKDFRSLDSGVLKDDDCERQKAELQSVQQCAAAAAATLGPDAERLKRARSGDGERVHCGDAGRKLLHDPERFYRCVCWSGGRTERPDATKHADV